MIGRALALFVICGGVVLALSACGREAAAPAPTVGEKVLPLAPAHAALHITGLTGELSDLKVVTQVDAKTGAALDAPSMRGTLKFKNTSPDRAIRLLGGGIEYLDAAGAPIGLAPGRAEATFAFYSYQDRLDPGMETSQDIDVPFPERALDGRAAALTDIRLKLTYVATPYRSETVTLPVSIPPPRAPTDNG